MKQAFLLAVFAAALGAQVSYDEILKGPAENWLTYSGDFASQRYSTLRQIDRGNVKSLVPQWIQHLDGARQL